MFCRFRLPVTRLAGVQCRFLNIHEYQSKALLKEGGCKVEFGIPAQSLTEVKSALEKIKTEKKVVKSQILAGGRGKGTFIDGFQGGVKVCPNAEAALEAASQMLGNTLVTKQTGPKGQKVNTLYITEAIPQIKRELYVALILDRKTASPMFIASSEGGMGIEELAVKSPEMIKKLCINIHDGLDMESCVRFAKELNFSGESANKAAEQFSAMYNVAKKHDCTMVEINPLVELQNGDVMCLDAKLSFDDNASFRHPYIFSLEDKTLVDPKEIMAKSADLNYIALDGNVGCLVNGAGLAMSTMDLIALYNQKPANFLDVGGNADVDQIVTAFEILSGDSNVKSILVNIFGGIMSCATIARGIVGAFNQLKDKITVPMVVRLHGTHEEEGFKILRESGLNLTMVSDLDEAGRTACELAKQQVA